MYHQGSPWHLGLWHIIISEQGPPSLRVGNEVMRFRLSYLWVTVGLVLLGVRLPTILDSDSDSPTIVSEAQAQEQDGGSTLAEGGFEEGSFETEELRPVEIDRETEITGPVSEFAISDFSPEEIKLLYELDSRRRSLDDLQFELLERESVIAAAEKRVLERQRQLEVVREEIAGLLKQYDELKREEVTRLVAVYENMRPRSAASIFNDLDLDTLLLVARRMNVRKLSPIVGLMNPVRARLITQELSADVQIPRIQ